MSIELLLNFSDANQLTVSLNGQTSQPLDFAVPIAAEQLQELKWYLEVYASQYMADIDDDRANRQAVQLKQLGKALYEAAFGDRAASRYFDRFLENKQPGRMLTINASQPEILALPWELLCVPGREAYVFNEKPRISVRRNLSQITEGYEPTYFEPKPQLRLLMVVSRPTDAGFIDPRTDAQATLKAVDRYGEGRIEVEFLRPGTLAALTERLENQDLPTVDILHFDGHGVFDRQGAINAGHRIADNPELRGGGKNTGYLLFEKADGAMDLVSAQRLGDLLHQQGLGLVVLSACQSSMYGPEGEDGETGAIGSVAARLTQTGVPSVLAMSYSVLVKTTEMLFGSFYGELVRGKGIGESLDNARRSLLLNPARGERSRGQARIVMRLEDWFVPTLYQSGADVGMIADASPNRPLAPNSGGTEPLEGMPAEPIAGFFGRRRELWAIERAFTPNRSEPRKETRRLTIAGFGGQGKTVLAAEAGRWLVRSGMFEVAVFVDYQAFQGTDGVALAVSTIARDLGVNLIDADAVTGELGRRRTLVILDNLEDLGAAVQQRLLTQAIGWSEAGQSRVLITTRQDDLGHWRYGRSGYEHQLIALTGLGTVAYPDDAIDYFQALMAVPPQPATLPGRQALIQLFAKVDFHPLSIVLVAEQLRSRGIVDVIKALDRLLEEVPEGLGKDRSLIASLNLSLDRLEGAARQLVRRLGVFQGGAFEDDLLVITEFTPEQWQPLRRQLESAGLVRAESLENVGVGVPFLKFHPTLARVLWASLGEGEQAELGQRHRERYYSLSRYLYHKDDKNPHAARAIVRRELPNLLVAVRGAIATNEDWAVDFVGKVNRFLNYFGMDADKANLSQCAETASKSSAVGSDAWYQMRSNAGEVLYHAGQSQAAMKIFEEILTELGETVSYRRCFILLKLGDCWAAQHQMSRAAMLYHQALAISAQLEPDEGVKRQMAVAQEHLGNVLTDMGEYRAAKQAYESSLAISRELGNYYSIAIGNGELGTLAMLEGNLSEAEKRYQSSIQFFQELNEPRHLAIYLHQLGLIYRETKTWDKAERVFRSVAQIEESQDNLLGAAMAWDALASVCQYSGKLQEAEAWCRKAIDGFRKSGNPDITAGALTNLANLLQDRGGPHLSEARQLAEEALDLKKSLDISMEIWQTYNLLASIATQQGEPTKAQDYRRLSRQSYVAFAGSRYALQQLEEVIQGVVDAVGDVDVSQQLAEVLPQWSPVFAKAIQRIWAGVRDEDELCDELDWEEGAIVVEILGRL